MHLIRNILGSDRYTGHETILYGSGLGILCGNLGAIQLLISDGSDNPFLILMRVPVVEFVTVSGHAGSMINADQCQIKFVALTLMPINKSHSRSMKINTNQYFSY